MIIDLVELIEQSIPQIEEEEGKTLLEEWLEHVTDDHLVEVDADVLISAWELLA